MQPKRFLSVLFTARGRKRLQEPLNLSLVGEQRAARRLSTKRLRWLCPQPPRYSILKTEHQVFSKHHLTRQHQMVFVSLPQVQPFPLPARLASYNNKGGTCHTRSKIIQT